MKTGVVDVVLDKDLPEGMKRLASYLRRSIISGEIDPFLAKIRDQKGWEVCDGVQPLLLEELMQMDWLCDTVDGEIPAFEELLPYSRGLVRLLGVYRDRIVPEKQEKQL